MNKQETINLIAGRIQDEYRKHHTNIESWATIAATKLYDQWSIFKTESDGKTVTDLDQKEVWKQVLEWDKINNPFHPDEMKYTRNSLLEFGVFFATQFKQADNTKEIEELRKEKTELWLENVKLNSDNSHYETAYSHVKTKLKEAITYMVKPTNMNSKDFLEIIDKLNKIAK